jgi:hypothetical protein
MAEERWNDLRAELEKSGKGIPSPSGPLAQLQTSMDRPIPSTNNQWDRGATPTPPTASAVPQIVAPTLPPPTVVPPSPNLMPAPPR